MLAAQAATVQLPNVVIVTAIPPNPCAFPTADYINKLSISNKQDYAHLHGFEAHLSAGMIDPNVTAVRDYQPIAWLYPNNPTLKIQNTPGSLHFEGSNNSS